MYRETYVYIYIYRERERLHNIIRYTTQETRKGELGRQGPQTYIYIYIERERDI